MVSSLRLLKLQGVLFQKDSPKHGELISFLTQVINDGYDINKKYNIILSTRIKNESMFISDLGFYNPENSILVLVKPKDLPPNKVSEQLNDHILIEEQDLTFDFDGLAKEQIIGTIGLKAVKDEGKASWELTGFVSNAKGVGKYLINKVSELGRAYGIKTLLASVIFEHNLTTYYGQYGFIEYAEKQKQNINENGLVVSGTLEDDIYATQDFHISFLRKTL